MFQYVRFTRETLERSWLFIFYLSPSVFWHKFSAHACKKTHGNSCNISIPNASLRFLSHSNKTETSPPAKNLRRWNICVSFIASVLYKVFFFFVLKSFRAGFSSVSSFFRETDPWHSKSSKPSSLFYERRLALGMREEITTLKNILWSMARYFVLWLLEILYY